MRKVIFVIVLAGLLVSASTVQQAEKTEPKPKSKSSSAQTKTPSSPAPKSVQPQPPSVPPPSGIKGGPMVYIPAGEFWMGCTPEDKECYYDEKPYRQVYLDDYYIDKYEVTQGEYNECVREKKCGENKKYDGFTGDRQPVVGVTKKDAESYCKWAGKRLPTEAEWEKVARGTEGRIYPWGNIKPTSKFANFSGTIGATKPVGSYPSGASPYGVMDLSGNVWEWIGECYMEDYHKKTSAQNPKASWAWSNFTFGVLRGGSWNSSEWNLRASLRYWDKTSTRNAYYGFRCAHD